MSSDYGYHAVTAAARSVLVPPPPPQVPGSATGPQRRLFPVQPPAISTTLPGSQAQYLSPYTPTQTPSSATSLSSPFTPQAPASRSPLPPSTPRGTSPMALRSSSGLVAAYNPQEWGRSGGAVAGGYVPYAHSGATNASSRTQHPTPLALRDITGMEASMPSPPPPYSPGHGQTSMAQQARSSPQVSGSSGFGSGYGQPSAPVDYSSPMSPGSVNLPSAAPAQFNRSSTIPVQRESHSQRNSGVFPPPPPVNTRDRSTSRSRPESGRSLFSLSALRHRDRSTSYHESTPASAIDTLQQNTTEVLSRTPAQILTDPSILPQHQLPVQPFREQQYTPESDIRAPASRRAVSTGAIGMSEAFRRTESRTPPSNRLSAWEPGMPLPPPPPGPPPSGLRSQSSSRVSDRSSNSSRGSNTPLQPPALRRPPGNGTTLGPVPPTPAGWVDEDVTVHARSKSPYRDNHGLYVDTSTASTSQQHAANADMTPSISSGSASELSSAVPSSSTSANSGGLTRAPAKRDPSARGIRERRSESRAARERLLESTRSPQEPSNNPWAEAIGLEATIPSKPADLVLGAENGTINRRRAIASSRSSKLISPSDVPGSASSNPSYGDSDVPDSNQSTPRSPVPPKQLMQAMSPELFGPTPPFSPSIEKTFGSMHSNSQQSPALPPKALPTPPIQKGGDDYVHSSLAVRSLKANERPVSHILHVPNEEASMPAPLVPARPSSSGVSVKSNNPDTKEVFAQNSLNRHRQFIEREMAAQTDQERLEVFAEYIVAESRLRRDRYSTAFNGMASDVLELTRDMWRSYNASTGRRTPSTGRSTNGFNSMTDTPTNGSTAQTPSSSRIDGTPRSQPDSPMFPPPRNRPDSQFVGQFQPCLSPIPSMGMSTVPDEEDSRGRTPSRWWESSVTGSQGRGGHKLERSKRESKYMGLPKEAREHLQYETNERSPSNQATATRSTSHAPSYAAYGPNEYPPEKGHQFESQAEPSPYGRSFAYSAPATPDPYKLDVSRLVTLPPPYPRHHPAVNNNHPVLASIRETFRNLTDLADATERKERYSNRVQGVREHESQRLTEQRKQLRQNIQDNIAVGHMSYADAAKAEADFEVTENKKIQERAKSEFDTFKTDVVSPLHALFSERITKATACIEQLRCSLFNEAQESNPNQTQEEGDEQPELLEKLTLLKWLFEAREQLHKESFELETEQSNLYKNVVITPYRLANNEEKVREAEDFFQRDNQDRKLVFEKQTLKRFEDFLSVVEENVTRGVEIQLSAFWDIAPGLLAVVQKIPSRLQGFEVLIPPMEYEENPVYHAHPLQYLHSLLSHAGKSAYQFIESQINLLCLLHEVKTGVMAANTRLLEMQRYLEGEDYATVEEEMKAVREDEEGRLTADLKEKVRIVEGQWKEALGEGLDVCKERVEGYLMETGGWDESLQE